MFWSNPRGRRSGHPRAPCPRAATRRHRPGPEKAIRMMFTGHRVSGVEVAGMGFLLKSVPDNQLHAEVAALATRMATVPISQLAMQKMLINSAVEGKINQMQRLVTAFDGITPHAPEGIHYTACIVQLGWKQAAQERDVGSFDCTRKKPYD